MTRRALWSVALAAVTVLATAGSAMAQGGGRFGFRFGLGGGRPLLRMPEVQRELKLEQAQIEQLNALPQNRINREEFQNLSPEERQKRLAEIRAERDKKVAEILKPDQLARLKQLELQDRGIHAITEMEIADKLQLTAEQRSKVREVQQGDLAALRDALQSAAGASQDERRAAMEKLREQRRQSETKLNAILTDAQKKQFQEMQGAPFTFPERRRGGGNN